MPSPSPAPLICGFSLDAAPVADGRLLSGVHAPSVWPGAAQFHFFLDGVDAAVSILSANCGEGEGGVIDCEVATPPELNTTQIVTDLASAARISVSVPALGCTGTFPDPVPIAEGTHARALVVYTPKSDPSLPETIGSYVPSGGIVSSALACGFVSYFTKGLADRYAAPHSATHKLLQLLINGTVGLGVMYGVGQLQNPASLALMLINQLLGLIEGGPRWKTGIPTLALAALEIMNLSTSSERCVAAAKFCSQLAITTASTTVGQRLAGWVSSWRQSPPLEEKTQDYP